MRRDYSFGQALESLGDELLMDLYKYADEQDPLRFSSRAKAHRADIDVSRHEDQSRPDADYTKHEPDFRERRDCQKAVLVDSRIDFSKTTPRQALRANAAGNGTAPTLKIMEIDALMDQDDYSCFSCLEDDTWHAGADLHNNSSDALHSMMASTTSLDNPDGTQLFLESMQQLTGVAPTSDAGLSVLAADAIAESEDAHTVAAFSGCCLGRAHH